jgi:GxxExxY protein
MTRNQPDPGTPRRGDRAPLLDEALTREVIGAFYKVYNTLGYGFLESVYSKALFIELRLRGLRVEREVKAVVSYAGHRVGVFKIDLLVEGRLVLELKATRVLTPEDRRQLQNGLRATELELGLLFHFGPRPAFYRVISENSRK